MNEDEARILDDLLRDKKELIVSTVNQEDGCVLLTRIGEYEITCKALDDKPPIIKIEGYLREALVCYARSGRWGTCVACPRTDQGDVFPEFCPETERYDHKLDFAGIVELVNR